MIYKLIGAAFIISSVLYFVCSKLISDYFTYLYFDDILRLLRQMKTACNIGKTYNSVFSKINELKYYNSKGISLLINKHRLAISEEILKSAGKRNKKEEQEFLDYSISMVEKERNVYKSYIDTNKKTFFLTGISLGTITVIVLI